MLWKRREIFCAIKLILHIYDIIGLEHMIKTAGEGSYFCPLCIETGCRCKGLLNQSIIT
jgi:hypothetical protein